MSNKIISSETIQQIKEAQKNEITEYHIYTKLSKKEKNPANTKVLQNIADDEYRHYLFWKKFTKKDYKPKRFKIFKFYWISRILGLTFGIKLLERGEKQAQIDYALITLEIQEAEDIIHEEEKHEHNLIALLEEEKLDYVGSIVLGLNDALVELTGALAGLTFALQNTRLIAVAGLITGIAASFSMAASEYLSTKSEGDSDKALRASIYTGIAYITTVVLLILPYFVFINYFICLAATLVIALIIILFFNYYISVAKDLNFTKRFLEMAILSMGIASITFGIGYIVRITLGIEM